MGARVPRRSAFIIDTFIAVIDRQTMTPMMYGSRIFACRYGPRIPSNAHVWSAYDAVTAGERHGAQAAAVVGVKQFLALGWCEAQPAVAAGADDGGVGGGGFR